MHQVVEPEKVVPILYDAEVVVAGAGVSGVFAAIAAARQGAKTVLVDRFGYVGGNIGPGLICQGHLASGRPHPNAPAQASVYPGFMGLAKEFIERHAAAGGGCVPPYSKCHYPRDSGIAAYTAMKMLEESGVRLVLSAYVADPIMTGKRVTGIFIEGKSGRQAIRAKVVIDATGEADVARRAGAPILQPKQEYHELDGHSPTGVGLSFVVAGIDWKKYDLYAAGQVSSDDDIRWGEENLGVEKTRRLSDSAVLTHARKAWEAGEYGRQELVLDGTTVGTRVSLSRMVGEDLAWGLASPERVEEVDVGSTQHISMLEAKLRTFIFEHVQIYRRYVPGFEQAYLLVISPYIGARGGPCVEGEYTLTMDDCRAGRRFEDVIYLYGEFRALRYSCEKGECKWTDLPYKVMVPKGIDGLLCVGRSASGIPDTLLRNRMAAKHMGEACGIAAAICAAQGTLPRDIDIKQLQGTLIDRGFHLGSLSRLRELGLV